MQTSKEQFIHSLLKLMMGWIFLWAFLDKVFGLGFSTIAEKSWLAGHSPTIGFLSGVKGPFAPIFNSMAGNPFVDWLFMMGLLGIGFALIFGVGKKIAGYAGFLMMSLMWLASFPIKTNPFVDDHLIYAIIFISIIFSKSDHPYALGKWWASTKLVKKFPWLE